jgi:hypothetical protein
VVRPPLKFKVIERHDFDADPGYVIVERSGNPGTLTIGGGYIRYGFGPSNSGGYELLYDLGRELPPWFVFEFRARTGVGYVNVGLRLGMNKYLVVSMLGHEDRIMFKYVDEEKNESYTYVELSYNRSEWQYVRLIVASTAFGLYISSDGSNWSNNNGYFYYVDPRMVKVNAVEVEVGNSVGDELGEVLVDYVELSYFGGFGYGEIRKVANPDGTWYRDSDGYYYIYVALPGYHPRSRYYYIYVALPGYHPRDYASGLVRTRNPADLSTWELYTVILFRDESGGIYSHHGGWIVVNGSTARIYASTWGNIWDYYKVGIISVDVPTSSLFVNDVVIVGYNSNSDVWFYDDTIVFEPAVVYYGGMWYYAHTIGGAEGNDIYLLRCSSFPRFPEECSEVVKIRGVDFRGGVFNMHEGIPRLYFIDIIGGVWHRYSLDGVYEASYEVPNNYKLSHPTGFPQNYMIIHSYVNIALPYGDADIILVDPSFYNESIPTPTPTPTPTPAPVPVRQCVPVFRTGVEFLDWVVFCIGDVGITVFVLAVVFLLVWLLSRRR